MPFWCKIEINLFDEIEKRLKLFKVVKFSINHLHFSTYKMLCIISDWVDLSFVEYHVSNPVLDAGGFADISLRIEVELNGAAVLNPTTSPDTDAYVISAFLTKEENLNSPAMIKQV